MPIVLLALPVAVFAQTGPSDPQLINAASQGKVNIGQRKLGGQMVATVKVDEAGKVGEVTVTENTTDDGFEPQLVKVLQNARFRPAIDESGKPVAATVDLKVELRPSTGSMPKPVLAKPDPQLTEKEKARIRKMKCSDFGWEWRLIENEADDAAATEFMPASPPPCTRPIEPSRANTWMPRCGRLRRRHWPTRRSVAPTRRIPCSGRTRSA